MDREETKTLFYQEGIILVERHSSPFFQHFEIPSRFHVREMKGIKFIWETGISLLRYGSGRLSMIN